MRYVLIIILIVSSAFCDKVDDLFNKGNEAMVAEDYSEAIKIYESILNIGYESSELYYNLGNGYFRLELIGNSIWAYNNALDMAPRDRDIIYNLSIVKMQAIDRIEMPETFIFLKIYRAIKLFFTVFTRKNSPLLPSLPTISILSTEETSSLYSIFIVSFNFLFIELIS